MLSPEPSLTAQSLLAGNALVEVLPSHRENLIFGNSLRVPSQEIGDVLNDPASNVDYVKTFASPTMGIEAATHTTVADLRRASRNRPTLASASGTTLIIQNYLNRVLESLCTLTDQECPSPSTALGNDVRVIDSTDIRDYGDASIEGHTDPPVLIATLENVEALEYQTDCWQTAGDARTLKIFAGEGAGQFGIEPTMHRVSQVEKRRSITLWYFEYAPTFPEREVFACLNERGFDYGFGSV